MMYVTVRPVNDAPLAADDEAGTPEDSAVNIDVQANDSDVEGSTLTTALVDSEDAGSNALPKAEDLLRTAAPTTKPATSESHDSAITRVDLGGGATLLHKRIAKPLAVVKAPAAMS